MKKRFLGLALVVTLAMLLIPMALADECFHTGSWHYEYDEETHWEVCDDCGEIVWGPEEHYAYCDKPDICAYCNAAYTGSYVIHNGERWEYDEDSHWRVCAGCGEKESYTSDAHWAYCEEPNVCAACGAPYSGNKISHWDTFLEYDEDTHWRTCENCGEMWGDPQEHWAYCDELGVCGECGAPYTGDNRKHREHVRAYDENKHWYACKNCGAVDGGLGLHLADCDAPDVCADCGAPYTGTNIYHRSTTMEHDENTHWSICDDCGEITWGPEEHEAYCDQPGTCAACDAPYTGSNITHYGEEMADENMHWFACYNCTYTSYAEEHWACCNRPDECYICFNNYPNLRIEHLDTIVKYDENTHWETCLLCDEITLAPEQHRASDADPTVCGVCGAPMPGSGGITTDPTPGTSGQAPATVWDASLGKLTTPDNPTYTGFAAFEGGKFYIENGQQKTDFVGPVQIDGTFYAFDQGRLQTENMMMAFEGGLFAFNGGTLRTDLIGLAAYDGEQFVFDHGQYQRQASGPYLDPISGKWVYVNEGQFYPITDLVSYDGEVFYFVDGFLAIDFTGIVYDFNDTGFYIASGQHYKITDLVSCNGEVLYVVDGKFASWYTGVVKDFQGAELNVVNGKVLQ